jgi:hypothetical protein
MGILTFHQNIPRHSGGYREYPIPSLAGYLLMLIIMLLYCCYDIILVVTVVVNNRQLEEDSMSPEVMRALSPKQQHEIGKSDISRYF